jgi:hypothetical protein
MYSFSAPKVRLVNILPCGLNPPIPNKDDFSEVKAFFFYP